MRVEFEKGPLSASEQALVSEGFRAQSAENNSPVYRKEQVKWLRFDERDSLCGALAADILWDWIYVDERCVATESRRKGIGRQLMQCAEQFACSQGLQGIWLWTQSWQAEDFYRRLGYREFTRFDNFPAGHARIGFRKTL